ncbi:unnamed protein product [Absidia cylindrospora]
MYESHHQPDTLTDMDYQLMLESNAFAKCNPNMVDFNHPDYMTLMQAQSLPLEPSLVDQSYHHEDAIIGSDSSSSSNEQLYYNQQQQQHQQQQQQNNPSLDLQQPSSTAESLQIHFSNPDNAAPTHHSSMFMASSAPVSSSMTNHPSNTDHSSIITRQNIPAPSSSSSSSLSSASNYAPDRHQQYHDPLHHQPYRQTYGSDPSVYPSLEECVPTSSSTFYNNNNNDPSTNPLHANPAIDDMEASQYHHLEQFYGQSLDEQQQFFLMQQHQQQLWAQQQQQYQQQQQQQQQMQHTGYPPRHLSPSSSSSTTAYTTESDSRPQIYVRKACVACKQSHVACDVQRPCSRCVRLNKAESCVDAERKKEVALVDLEKRKKKKKRN